MKFDKYVHFGVVVKDYKKTIEVLENAFGIGPWRVNDFPPAGVDPSQLNMTYHGKKGDFKAKFCFANIGDTEIEVIQPVEGDSVWFDFLEEHGDGIHHVKFFVDSIVETKEYLESKGYTMLQSGVGVGPNEGRTWAYFKTQEDAGFILEVLSNKRYEKLDI